MKYWIPLLIGGYFSVNAIVIATTSLQPNPLRSRLLQETVAASLTDDGASSDPDRVLFDGWPTPEFSLLISGRLDGYIEPCGCTGLENQKGGMLRRTTLLKQLVVDRGWTLAAIDTGNQIHRTGVQSIIKLKTAWRGMFQTMGYQLSSLGVDDLKTPIIDLISTIENLNLGGHTPFVCANVDLFDGLYFKPINVFEIAGRRVGVTAVLGDEEIQTLRQVADSDLQFTPVDIALPRAIGLLQPENCDLRLLIVNASLEESRRLAARYPEFDLVVSANGIGEPTSAPERIEGNGKATSLIQVGSKGMHVGVVGFFREGDQLSMRYQRVPLDARFEDAEEMKAIFKDYQTELARKTFAELQILPKRHPSDRRFVGSESCQDCHEYAYDVWERGHKRDDNPDRVGPHFRATLDLVEPGERTWVTREKDPECLSCHVTGWNPQGYFPYETGYASLEDEALHGNGCENCHGPGSLHVDAENEDIEATKEQIEQYRQDMIVTLEAARNELCMTCHDLDNSPDFHHPGAFEEYWAKIDHTKKKAGK